MKFYSHKTFATHREDLKVLRDNELNRVIPFVSQIANTFPRESVAIGVLDVNDLIQAGYIGLMEAWNLVDWDMINLCENPQGKLWSYLKKRIKGNIRREIDKYGSFVSRPINQQEKMRSKLSEKGVDKILVSSFPKFFDNNRYLEFVEDNGPYRSLLLERIIDEELIRVEPNVDYRDMILFYYGIGRDKLSSKEIGEKFKQKTNTVVNIIHRVRKKLDNQHFKKIIENFYENA